MVEYTTLKLRICNSLLTFIQLFVNGTLLLINVLDVTDEQFVLLIKMPYKPLNATFSIILFFLSWYTQ